MAEEAIVFSMTPTNYALVAASQINDADIDITSEDAGVVPTATFALYALKTAYNGNLGKAKLLQALEQLKAKILKTSFPQSV